MNLRNLSSRAISRTLEFIGNFLISIFLLLFSVLLPHERLLFIQSWVYSSLNSLSAFFLSRCDFLTIISLRLVERISTVTAFYFALLLHPTTLEHKRAKLMQKRNIFLQTLRFFLSFILKLNFKSGNFSVDLKNRYPLLFHCSDWKALISEVIWEARFDFPRSRKLRLKIS